MMREALAGAVTLGWPEATVILAADFPQAWSAAADIRAGPDHQRLGDARRDACGRASAA